MSLWGRVFAATYDRALAGTEAGGLRARREALLTAARGRVLEIGAGTGANLAFYGDGVESLTLTEPEAPMARRLRRRVDELRPGTDIAAAPAERLPFADDSFDTVVCTLVLCTVGDLPRALGEIRRVLAPGGRLLFIEHVRADDARLAGWQDRLNPVQRRVAHGCNCNRDTVAQIRAAAFEIGDLEHDTLHKAPPIIRPLVVGTATTAA